MPKYRKKPVVIEAMQAVDDLARIVAIANWVVMNGGSASDPHSFYPDGTVLRILTLEGTMDVSLDDFVIRGIKGEFYPCKPHIFEATYELVQEN